MSIQEHNLDAKVQAKLNKSADTVEIVDNLTEGGATKALSAEAGKKAKEFIDENKTELMRLATTMATNAQAGLAKIDNSTIKTNANGQLYATVAEWKNIDYGIVGQGLFTRDLAIYNTEGAWFRIGLGAIKDERRYQIDVSISPSGDESNKLFVNKYDLSIHFDKTSAGTFKNGVYYSTTPFFDNDRLMITLNEDNGEYFLGIQLSVVRDGTATDSRTLLCAVEKMIVKGINGKTAHLDEVENLNYSIMDDNGLAGMPARLSFKNPNKIGSMDIGETFLNQNDILNATFATSGYYMIQQLYPKAGDDFTDPIMCIVQMNKSTDNIDGTTMRMWTAYEVSVEDNTGVMIASITNVYRMMDGILDGQYVATGNWKHHSGIGFKKLQTDVQTLFTNWANEIDNMATALSQKGVATPQGSTAKIITTNIGLIPSGKRIKTASAVPGTQTYSWNYVASGTVSLPRVAVSLTEAGFKVGTIIVECANITGEMTLVRIFGGSMLSAQVFEVTANNNNGTSKWIRLGSSGMPADLLYIPIPITSAGTSYTITMIEA